MSFTLVSLLTPIWSVLMLFRVLSYARVRRFSLLEAVLWSCLWIGVGVIALFPQVLDQLPAFVGIQSGVNALVFFAFLLVFSGFFHLWARVEELEQKIVELVRKDSLDSSS